MGTSAAAVLVIVASMGPGDRAARDPRWARGLEHRLTVTIRVEDRGRLGRRSVALALDEAYALWAPYNVILARAADREEACLTITMDDLPIDAGAGASRALGLGSIDFAPGGRADRHVHVSVPAVIDMLNENASEYYGNVPQTVAPHVLARALGRVIAHEVGHFVLRYPAHVGQGLMAPAQSGAALSSTDRKRFALTALLEGRLREVARTGPCGCADAVVDQY